MFAGPDVGEFHVLLVEDNAAHAELVRRAFESHPHPNSLYHVSDGEEALDYLFRRGPFSEDDAAPRPNVVLLDLRLPKKDGLEVLSAIRESEELEQLPVVILTTSDADTDIAQAYERRVNSYLVKPTEFEAFEQLMLDIGSYWIGWNESPGRVR